MPHTDEGLILRKIKEVLSEAGFTLPHFHGHLDQVGFNDASEDDMHTVLHELEALKSRLHHMYFDEELDEKVQLMDDQIKEIKEVIDPSVDLEGFGAIPDEWDCDEDDGVGNIASDYAVVGLMGNDNGGEHFPLAAEDGFSPHSPCITSH